MRPLFNLAAFAGLMYGARHFFIFLNEHKKNVKAHNERLEFLGDSVLGMLIAEYLYCHLPLQPEGVLSRLRSKLGDAVVIRVIRGLGYRLDEARS